MRYIWFIFRDSYLLFCLFLTDHFIFQKASLSDKGETDLSHSSLYSKSLFLGKTWVSNNHSSVIKKSCMMMPPHHSSPSLPHLLLFLCCHLSSKSIPSEWRSAPLCSHPLSTSGLSLPFICSVPTTDSIIRRLLNVGLGCDCYFCHKLRSYGRFWSARLHYLDLMTPGLACLGFAPCRPRCWGQLGYPNFGLCFYLACHSFIAVKRDQTTLLRLLGYSAISSTLTIIGHLGRRAARALRCYSRRSSYCQPPSPLPPRQPLSAYSYCCSYCY